MARNSLNIENRICFDSDSGSGGGGGMSDEDLDQELQQDIAMAAAQRAGADTTGNYTFSDDFDQGSDDNQALIGATSNILAADRMAAAGGRDRNDAIGRAENFAAGQSSVQTALNNAMKAPTNLGAPAGNVPAPRFDGANNVLARQRLAQQLAQAQAYTPPAREPGIRGIVGYNTPQVALNTLQSQATQFMTPRIDNALQQPGMSPVYGYDGRVTGAANEFGQLIEGTDPMDNLGGGFGGGGISDDASNVFQRADDGSDAADVALPGGDIPSDELAIDFLQNPYYAYSGFGNQYNPYGYATGTLVDLLQTRGMTQPQQADTLGLFANPRDFV